MRKTLAAVAILMFASPVLAVAQIDNEPVPVKEYAVWFDKWGRVHCQGEGTRCTA